jgi:hypothetical protein
MTHYIKDRAEYPYSSYPKDNYTYELIRDHDKDNMYLYLLKRHDHHFTRI